MSAVTGEALETREATRRDAMGRSRAWAWAGVGAGACGLVGIQASLTVDAVYLKETAGDAEAITARLGELVPNLIVFHTATLVAVVLMVVFAAGLRRRLQMALPFGSLLPDVAFAGGMLVAVAGMMGTALDTEFIFAVSDPDRLVPESAALFGHWVGTVNWLWLGAGLSGVALAVAALRHGAAPRWIGWVGAVLGGLTLLLGISPLQYMAGFTGPVLVLVVALGFALGRRAVPHNGEAYGLARD